MEKKLILGFLVLAVLLSGCAGPKTTTTPVPTGQPTVIQPVQTGTLTGSPTQTLTSSPTQTLTAQPVTVEITGFAFVPATVTISKGTTIIWTQQDSFPHTVTGTGLDSGSLGKGQTFSYTFNEAGTFNYICSLHTSMKGTVIVQ